MVTPRIDELLERATSRQPVNPSDGKSGSTFERVVVDGRSYFLKRLSPAVDWIMRVTRDRIHRPYVVWTAGIMDRAPACIDHAVVAMEVEGEGETAELSVLMRDVGSSLVPEGDGPVPLTQHAGFVEHMAAVCATFWGFTEDLGLSTMEERVRYFAPATIAPELLAGAVPGPIAAAHAGWAGLAERSPLLARVASAVHEDPALVAAPLARTPPTFLHGDWKMGNLGSHPDGRTVLLDWAYPGSGPACWDLCWYLALNSARLPESKERAVERFRAALERARIATDGWWEAQLDLCTVAIMATFAWEKGLGDEGELRWWEQRVEAAVRGQGLAVPAPR
ncbi:MAG TPA: phosphotransferase [Candidatus Dormibacteraeota bacterium]|nr:phosphotransferase [Candidatus Dormibacteraeota bacterium]